MNVYVQARIWIETAPQKYQEITKHFVYKWTWTLKEKLTITHIYMWKKRERVEHGTERHVLGHVLVSIRTRIWFQPLQTNAMHVYIGIVKTSDLFSLLRTGGYWSNYELEGCTTCAISFVCVRLSLHTKTIHVVCACLCMSSYRLYLYDLQSKLHKYILNALLYSWIKHM